MVENNAVADAETTQVGEAETILTDVAQATAAETTGQTETQEQTEESKPEGAPEAYAFTAPEGKEFDAGLTDAFAAVAKDLNLSQDSAQTILSKMAPVLEARQAAQAQAMKSEWLESAKSDAEYGGAKLQENLGVAKKAMDSFANPALVTLLNETGLGSHPEVVRLFYKVGKTISEDRFVANGAQGGSAAANPAQRLFPNQSK